MEWSGWLAAAGMFCLTLAGWRVMSRARRKPQPKLPAKPDIDMETVFLYVTACAARRWRPVFTLDQFRAMYRAVMADPSIPHTDSLPPLYDRVTLYGVEIAVSDTPRPPMPRDMLDRDAPVEEPERVLRDLTAFARQRRAEGDTRHANHYARALDGGDREWDGFEPGGIPRSVPKPDEGGPYRSGYTDGSYEAHDLPPRSM